MSAGCPKHGAVERDKGGECKVCRRQRKAARRADPAYRERERQYMAAYRADPANREAQRQYLVARSADPAYREAQRQRFAAWYAAPANKEAQRQRMAAWATANPDKRNAHGAKRRAAKLQRTPAWADLSKIAEIYELAAEGQRLVGGAAVDHILPLQGKTVSGLHCELNLRLILDRHNSGKGNRVTPALLAQVEADITNHVRALLATGMRIVVEGPQRGQRP